MPWAPDYITAGELANYVRTDTSEQTELEAAIAAASRAVDEACNRQFGVVDEAEERRFAGWFNARRCRWVADIDDLMAGGDVTVEVGGTSVTGFTLEPVNAKRKGRPFTRLVFGDDAAKHPGGRDPDVAVTAVWGWSDVPKTIREATLLQASRFWSRRQSPHGVAGSPEIGSEVRLLARADPDVAVQLRAYVRDPAVVG